MKSVSDLKLLLESGSRESLEELIVYLQERAYRKESNQEYVHIFNEHLRKCNITRDSVYRMVGPKRGLSCFVSEMAGNLLGGDYEEEHRHLEDILKDLREVEDSDGPLLKMTQGKELLAVVVQKFNLNPLIGYNRYNLPLRFYFVPFGFKWNASFHDALNLVTIYKADLERAFSSEYVFLHEIGHAVQVSLSGDITKVPESFIPIIREQFPTCPEDVMPEIFADCFSYAAMEDTPYEDLNPFTKIFNEYTKLTMKEYFGRLNKQ